MMGKLIGLILTMFIFAGGSVMFLYLIGLLISVIIGGITNANYM